MEFLTVSGFFAGKHSGITCRTSAHSIGTQSHANKTDQQLRQRHVPILTSHRLNQPIVYMTK